MEKLKEQRRQRKTLFSGRQLDFTQIIKAELPLWH